MSRQMSRLVGLRAKLKMHAESVVRQAQDDLDAAQKPRDTSVSSAVIRPAGEHQSESDLDAMRRAFHGHLASQLEEKKALLRDRHKEHRQVERLLEQQVAETRAFREKKEAQRVDDWLRRKVDKL